MSSPSTVYPIPTVAWTMPNYAHTDNVFTVVVESKNVVEDASIKWHIDDTYGLRQNWGTYVAGNLTTEPGEIRIKHAGVFTLGCEITDPTGRIFSFDGPSIEVLAEQELQISIIEQQAGIAQADFERKQKAAASAQEVRRAEAEFQADMNGAMKPFLDTVQETVQSAAEDKPKEVIEQYERHKAEQEKQSVEDEVRAHLRGFSRTIPSFIMAYGDGYLTLANFDKYTEDDVFLEVTGITMSDFRSLRDGGEYTDPETGTVAWFEGHLFDEVVFNDSVDEFWKKKQQLADYFDESQEEDIFDYIPPQKTNQIFTPRWVVSMMVRQFLSIPLLFGMDTRFLPI